LGEHSERVQCAALLTARVQLPRPLSNGREELVRFKLGLVSFAAGVGPRHRGNFSGGNEPHFRPAGGLKNIVYEIRGAFDKYYLL
jgi:hypothetical protein